MPTGESSNYRPGEPLRHWSSDSEIARIDFALIVGHAKAENELRNLAQGKRLSLEEQLIIANLNAYCIIFWYEPLTLQVQYPELNETVQKMVEELL